MVRTQRFHYWGPGLVPGRGTKIGQAMQCGQIQRKKKEKLDANAPIYFLRVEELQ